jgi:hypothetical protein
MDSVTQYHQIIYPILKEYAELPYRYGEVTRHLIVSEDKLHYLLMVWGWENRRRLHGCIVHLEIIGDKIWIHEDGLEDGIATDLLRAGIPKNQIVLGFHPPEVRPYTEFAVS